MLAISTCLLGLAVPTTAPDAARPEVVSYDLWLKVEPEGREIRGKASVEVVSRGGELEAIQFSLNEHLKIDSLHVDDRKVSARRGDRIAEGRGWLVPLKPPLTLGETRTITFEYHGTGSDPGPKDSDWMGILLVREDEVRMSHQSQWYPIVPLDERARAKLAAPVSLELVLPAGMESLGPGAFEGKERMKSVEVHAWKSEGNVRPSILAGAYEAHEVRAGKQRVRVLAFPDHLEGAKKWGSEAAEAIGVLEDVFGKLDRVQYGIAEMHVRNRGKSYNYEADGFSVYDSVLFDGRDPDSKKIGHEVAHLYFGGAMDAFGPGERFMTESLAELAALIYVERRHGEAAATEAALRDIKRYFKSPGEEHSLASTDFASPRYSQVVYGKGALALRTLRAWLGAKEFDAALAEFIAQCREGETMATQSLLLDALKNVNAKAVDEWEEDWLQRTGAPRYELEYEVESQGARRGRVQGFLIQKGALFRNPVELGVVTTSGAIRYISVQPRARRMSFDARIKGTVVDVTIDPRAHVLFERE